MISREERGDIVVLTMTHGKANALDLELADELQSHLKACDGASPSTIVLTGSGSIFSAGVDLVRVLREDTQYLRRFLPSFSTALMRLFAYPGPVIAAVNGHAVAGGMILASACDYRIAADGTGTIGIPELGVGVPFPTAAIEVLRFALPPPTVQELVYTGHTCPIAEALSRRMVDEIAASDRLMGRAMEVAQQFAAIPTQSFSMTKRLLRQPTIDRVERLGPTADREVFDIWSSRVTLDAIRRYVERTLKRS
jgi:enoyl-CoA hydratase